MTPKTSSQTVARSIPTCIVLHDAWRLFKMRPLLWLFLAILLYPILLLTIDNGERAFTLCLSHAFDINTNNLGYFANLVSDEDLQFLVLFRGHVEVLLYMTLLELVIAQVVYHILSNGKQEIVVSHLLAVVKSEKCWIIR